MPRKGRSTWMTWLGMLILSGLVLAGLGSVAVEGRQRGRPAIREFQIITGEWRWEGKTGEKVRDRGRGPVSAIVRYTFEPGFLVVNKGDTVILKVHALKGDQHRVAIPDFGLEAVMIKRGEEKEIRFVAGKVGIFKIVCKRHDNPAQEGPMEAYLYVLDR